MITRCVREKAIHEAKLFARGNSKLEEVSNIKIGINKESDVS